MTEAIFLCGLALVAFGAFTLSIGAGWVVVGLELVLWSVLFAIGKGAKKT